MHDYLTRIAAWLRNDVFRGEQTPDLPRPGTTIVADGVPIGHVADVIIHDMPNPEDSAYTRRVASVTFAITFGEPE